MKLRDRLKSGGVLLMEKSQKKGVKEYERRIADAFIKYHLNKDNMNYRFVSRPDENHKGDLKLPDFEYYDIKTKTSLLLEFSRVTYKKARRLTSLKREFVSLKRNLDGKLNGTFALLIDYDTIPQKKTKKLRNRNKYFGNLYERISKVSKKMVVHENQQVDDSVTILKQDDNGSSLWFYPLHFQPYWTENPKDVIDLLKDAEKKFNNYQKSESKNILILIHFGLQQLRNEISVLLMDLKAFIHDRSKDQFSMFTGLYDFYILFLDIDWNTDITVHRFYPKPMSTGLGYLSDIFENRKEYWKFLDDYFPG